MDFLSHGNSVVSEWDEVNAVVSVVPWVFFHLAEDNSGADVLNYFDNVPEGYGEGMVVV